MISIVKERKGRVNGLRICYFEQLHWFLAGPEYPELSGPWLNEDRAVLSQSKYMSSVCAQ